MKNRIIRGRSKQTFAEPPKPVELTTWRCFACGVRNKLWRSTCTDCYAIRPQGGRTQPLRCPQCRTVEIYEWQGSGDIYACDACGITFNQPPEITNAGDLTCEGCMYNTNNQCHNSFERGMWTTPQPIPLRRCQHYYQT